MVDLASDHDSAISLIIDEYRRLKKHNENHDSLKYIYDVTDNGFKFNESFIEEFYKKFDHNYMAGILTKYYVDLRNAVDKIEGIDRSPKIEPYKPSEPKKFLTIEDKVKQPEDLPF